MLDPRIVDLARRRINVTLADRKDDLGAAGAQVWGEMAKNGRRLR
jgi:hypothetical protein